MRRKCINIELTELSFKQPLFHDKKLSLSTELRENFLWQT